MKVAFYNYENDGQLKLKFCDNKNWSLIRDDSEFCNNTNRKVSE